MNDEVLDREILSILAVQDSYPLSLTLLQSFLISSGIRTDNQSVLVRLQWLKDRGWADFSVNDYRVQNWFITDAGKVRRRQI